MSKRSDELVLTGFTPLNGLGTAPESMRTGVCGGNVASMMLMTAPSVVNGSRFVVPTKTKVQGSKVQSQVQSSQNATKTQRMCISISISIARHGNGSACNVKRATHHSAH